MQVESQNTTLLNVTDIFLCEESVIDDSFPGLDPNSTDIFALTLDFKTSSNFAIDDLKSDADSFAGVYSNSILNWSMVILYVLGFFINIPALGFVVVFEVTGEAGPYRTLINRLASHIISLMCTGYTVGLVSVLRAVSGPMPMILCHFESKIKQLVLCNVSFIVTSICATRYLIVCHYKHLPVMNDKFLEVFIVSTSQLLSFLAVMGKFMLEDLPGMGESICAGTWSKMPDEIEKKFIPAPAIIVLIGGLVDLVTSLTIYFVRKKVTIVQPFNHQAASPTNLGSLLIAWLYRSIIAFLAIAFFTINKSDPVELNETPMGILVFISTTIIPVVGATVKVVTAYCSKPNLRAAAKRVLKG